MPLTRTARRAATLLAALGLVTASLVRPAAAQQPVYLSLGDSLAFGTTNVVPVSFGDQGYVRPFADFLGQAVYGGVRPKVDNLAISGELSSSFLTGVPPAGWTERLPLNNLNYASDTQSQADAFLSAVAAEKAAGNSIDYVSFSIGANDLGALLQSPAFNDPNTDKAALLTQALQTVQANDLTILSEVRAQLPDAHLLLLNYYNPFAVLGPNDPFNQLATQAALADTQMVQGLATQFHGQFVDIYTPFVGHEAAYTYILSGNVHPNAAGYAVIAQRMEQSAIPEPSAFCLLGLGLPGLLLATRRRKARAAA